MQNIALLAYPILALGALGILTAMILRIGRMLGDCPQSQARAQAAAVTIATGYAAIGLGGVFLGLAAVFVAQANPAVALGILGLVTLCLGLGFGHAIATLRAVTQPNAAQVAEPAAV